MAELSREQVNVAVEIAAGCLAQKYCVEDVLVAVAPYLQLPWDEPNAEECKELSDMFSGHVKNPAVAGAKAFVRLRNAALIPKPVDPRREAIVKTLTLYGIIPATAGFWAGEILKDLDKVKPRDFYRSSVLYPDTSKIPMPREPFVKQNSADEKIGGL